MAAALTGSTPAKAPTPTEGNAKDMNSASERVIIFLVTCSVIVFFPFFIVVVPYVIFSICWIWIR